MQYEKKIGDHPYYEKDNPETCAKRIRILISENVQSTCIIFREKKQGRTIISGQ